MGARGGRSPARHDDELRGVALWLARAGWVAASALLLALNIAAIPRAYAELDAICHSAAGECGSASLNPTQVSELPSQGLTLASYAAAQVTWITLGMVVTMVVGVIIFLRRSSNRMALFVSFTLVLFAATIGRSPGEGLIGVWAVGEPARVLLVAWLKVLSGICFAALFYLFPSGRWVPRWTLLMMPVWAVYQIAFNVYWQGVSGQAATAKDGLNFLLSITMIGAQVYRYRAVSTPSERRQTRWVAYGFAIGLAGSLVVGLINALALPPFAKQTPLQLFLVDLGIGSFFTLIPIAFGVAMVRSHLFDIDVLIKRTLVYGSLSLALAAVYFAGVVGLQQVMRPFTGQQGSQPWMVVLTTLLIAALFTPLRRGLQALIDQRFDRARYDAARTLEGFAASMRSEVDLSQLSSSLLDAVNQSLRPAHVSLWLHPQPAHPHEEPET